MNSATDFSSIQFPKLNQLRLHTISPPSFNSIIDKIPQTERQTKENVKEWTDTMSKLKYIEIYENYDCDI